MFLRILILVCSYLAVCTLAAADSSEFKESLVIKPLPHGQVYTHFEFRTLWDQDIRTIRWATHYDLFPMALGKFIAKHELQELHFSLTKGLWKHKLWGYPIRDALPGAELWAWFQPFHRNPEKGWKEVTSLLSGQFCASLNFIDNAASISPRYSFRPEGVVEDVAELQNGSVFYAALPHEAVCTENLTPWKKLLPCFSKAGIATLLSAVHLFNTNYFSLALDLRPVCKDAECTKTSLELVQSISVVFNPPIMFEGKQSWSLFKLFGTSLSRGECKLARSSLVYVDITHNDTSNPLRLQPEPTKTIDSYSVTAVLKNDADNSEQETEERKKGRDLRKFAVYDVKEEFAKLLGSGKQLNIASLYKKEHAFWLPQSPALSATRFISGYGVSQGGIVSRITNKLPKAVKIAYLDVIPWYLRIYLHTLTITSNGVSTEPDSMYYKPAKDRSQPHHIELLVTLPASSVTEIRIEFDRSYLKWTEYPPDANHGVYVGSAIISAKLEDTRNLTVIPSATRTLHDIQGNSFFLRIHTESLLVSLPTPDFSMPYNVICLVSTVVSLAFGPLHNLTTRHARVAPDVPESEQSTSLFAKLRNKFRKKAPENLAHVIKSTNPSAGSAAE